MRNFVQVVVFSYQWGTFGPVINRHPLNAAVAAELSGYLKAARMSQAQLADATGMNEVVIQRYLAGTRDINVTHIARFAEALNFEPQDLMERAGKRIG
jgi:transcriptional regulator with XRE-family HTH domain